MTHPFCAAPHTLSVQQTGLTSFTMYAAYPPDPVCVGISFDMQFSSDCATASGTAINDNYPDIPIDVTLTRESTTAISVGKVIIPADAQIEYPRVRSKKYLLTKTEVGATIIEKGKPAVGIQVTLGSSRPTKDTIVGPNIPTNSQGSTTATVQTRDQTESSIISILTPASAAGASNRIDWLPATYETPFQITCYNIAEQVRFSNTNMAAAPGLPAGSPKYPLAFLQDTMMQGSGLATDGRYLHYNYISHLFTYEDCAITASLACASEGDTVAVDPTYVPFRSTLNVEILGQRSAVDTGTDIVGPHIDEFYGLRRDECRTWGRNHYSTVQVLNKPWRTQ